MPDEIDLALLRVKTDKKLTALAERLGLLGMRERARRLGGDCTVVSRPEGGTLVSASHEDLPPGLSPEDLSRLFGRFQRLSAKPTAGESSTVAVDSRASSARRTSQATAKRDKAMTARCASRSIPSDPVT